MSIALLSCAVALPRVPLAAQSKPVTAKPEPVQKIERGFKVSRTVNMRAYLPAGSITIRTWDRDSVHVAGTMTAGAEFFGGSSGDHMKFGVDVMRTGDSRLPSGILTVTIPRAAQLWVKMTNGTIDAEGTQGTLELYTVGGSVTVRRASGVLSVETIDAAITVEQSHGDIRLRGGKAPVALRDVLGTASVATVSGAVTISGASPECRVETIGGDIIWHSTALRGATAELQTHSGTMRVDVNPRTMPQLDLSSRTGKVTPHATTGSPKEGRIVARSFRGAINVVTVGGIQSGK